MKSIFLLAVISLILIGCSESPDYRTPEEKLADLQIQRKEILDSIKQDSIRFFDSLKISNPDSYQFLITAESLKQAEIASRWQLVGSYGYQNGSKFVYVRPDLISDTSFLYSIIKELHPNKNFCQIHFFDNIKYTPSNLQVFENMSDAELNHHKAIYTFNPNNGFEELEFYR